MFKRPFSLSISLTMLYSVRLMLWTMRQTWLILCIPEVIIKVLAASLLNIYITLNKNTQSAHTSTLNTCNVWKYFWTQSVNRIADQNCSFSHCWYFLKISLKIGLFFCKQANKRCQMRNFREGYKSGVGCSLPKRKLVVRITRQLYHGIGVNYYQNTLYHRQNTCLSIGCQYSTNNF